jgi:2-octaprenyl-6-methoxyphenol hydroxylase
MAPIITNTLPISRVVLSPVLRSVQVIGVAERLEGQGCPIRSIRVSDGLEPGGIQFDAGPGDASLVDPLGIMFENRLLRRALRETAEAAEHVTLLQPAARPRWFAT